jgi:hypothetical protein
VTEIKPTAPGVPKSESKVRQAPPGGESPRRCQVEKSEMTEEDGNITQAEGAENGPTGAILAAVRKFNGDSSFEHVPGTMFGFRANIDGKKVGVALATKSERFFEHVLNKADIDGVLNALGAGRLDHGFGVTVKFVDGTFTFVDMMEASELSVTILAKKTPVPGKRGPFYQINPHFTDEEGF